MNYNHEYGILFKFNPIMECMLGQFEGWRIVLQLFNDSIPYDKNKHDVEFTYNKSSWKKLLKFINKKY